MKKFKGGEGHFFTDSLKLVELKLKTFFGSAQHIKINGNDIKKNNITTLKKMSILKDSVQ